MDLRTVFPHADVVKVASGNSVTVFNISGNHYRLITAIYYNRGMIYALDFLNHADYSKDRWKETLRRPPPRQPLPSAPSHFW